MIGYSAGGQFHEVWRSHNRLAPKVPTMPNGIGMVVRQLGTTQELPDLPAPSETSTPPTYYELEARTTEACRKLCTSAQTLAFLDGLKEQTDILSFLVGEDDARFLSNYSRGIERIQARLSSYSGPITDEDREATCKALTEVSFIAVTEAAKNTAGTDTVLEDLDDLAGRLMLMRPCGDTAGRRKLTGKMMLGGGLALMALGAVLMKGKRKS